jgi:hypothetical protein
MTARRSVNNRSIRNPAQNEWLSQVGRGFHTSPTAKMKSAYCFYYYRDLTCNISQETGRNHHHVCTPYLGPFKCPLQELPARTVQDFSGIPVPVLHFALRQRDRCRLHHLILIRVCVCYRVLVPGTRYCTTSRGYCIGRRTNICTEYSGESVVQHCTSVQ